MAEWLHCKKYNGDLWLGSASIIVLKQVTILMATVSLLSNIVQEKRKVKGQERQQECYHSASLTFLEA